VRDKLPSFCKLKVGCDRDSMGTDTIKKRIEHIARSVTRSMFLKSVDGEFNDM
jgi:hypothetical protein